MSLKNKPKKFQNEDTKRLFELLEKVENTPISPKIVSQPTYNLPVKSETLEEIADLSRKTLDLTQKLIENPDYSYLRQEPDLYKIISNNSKIDMTLRSCILGRRDSGYPQREKELVSHYNIAITQPQNAILRVLIPPLIGRRFSGSYNIYWKLKSAFAQHEIEHGFEPVEGKKVVLIYKRYVTNSNVAVCCDNDNFEMQRTTNAISESVNWSDNAVQFSMMYTAVESSVDCVEATLCLQENFVFFLDYMLDKTPPAQAFSITN